MTAIDEMDPTVVQFVDGTGSVIYPTLSPEQLAAIKQRVEAGEVTILPTEEAEKVVDKTWRNEGLGREGKVVTGSYHVDTSGIYGIE